MSSQLQDGQVGKGQSGRYRAVSRPAVVSLICGVLSMITVLHWFLALIPALGIVLGRFALLRIREIPEELSGRGLARAGVILSVGFWVAGYGWLTFRRVSEVPFGYHRVEYEDLQPEPGERVPSEIYELEEKDWKVFVKGYMLPGRQHTRLKAFILCPAIPNCPFCTPDPTPTEMILVRLEGDLEAEFTTHLVGVAGKLQVDENPPNGLPYTINANYMKSPP